MADARALERQREELGDKHRHVENQKRELEEREAAVEDERVAVQDQRTQLDRKQKQFYRDQAALADERRHLQELLEQVVDQAPSNVKAAHRREVVDPCIP